MGMTDMKRRSVDIILNIILLFPLRFFVTSGFTKSRVAAGSNLSTAGLFLVPLQLGVIFPGIALLSLKMWFSKVHLLFLIDHKCGYCSLLPNLITGFGWNPGNKLLKWFGETLKEQTGNADITFREVITVFYFFIYSICPILLNSVQDCTEPHQAYRYSAWEYNETSF